MSRLIELTVTATVRADDVLTPQQLRDHVRGSLLRGFENKLLGHPLAVHVVAVNDPDGNLHMPPNVQPLLARFGQAAVIWSVEDVLDVRPDLSYEQAEEVLVHTMHRRDTQLAVGWETFEYFAMVLYGEPLDTEGGLKIVPFRRSDRDAV